MGKRAQGKKKKGRAPGSIGSMTLVGEAGKGDEERGRKKRNVRSCLQTLACPARTRLWLWSLACLPARKHTAAGAASTARLPLHERASERASERPGPAPSLVCISFFPFCGQLGHGMLLDELGLDPA